MTAPALQPEPRRHTAESEAVQRDVLTLAAIGRDPRLIPATWEGQAALIDTAVAMGHRLTLVAAMIVARSKGTFADPADWVRSCTTRWGWQPAHLHHACAIGALLLNQPQSVAATLMMLDSWKLLSISRLPRNLVAPFIERAMPVHLSRDEVRAAVNRWLKAAGEPSDDAPTPRRDQPSGGPSRAQHQYDFLDLLFAPTAEIVDPQIFHDQVHARAGAVDPCAAQLVAFRSVCCLDALVPRLAAAGARDLAAALRDVALQADQQAVRGV